MRELPAAERFWSHVEIGRPYECWPWIGTRDPNGYGRVWLRRRGRRLQLLAHRVAYELAVGAIPDGLFVCHHCDSPPCCNPAHLWAGDAQANMADAARKGRTRALKGEQSPVAKLTNAAVLEIRTRYAQGETQVALAAEFSVSPSLIAAVVHRRVWKHVGGLALPVRYSMRRRKLSADDEAEIFKRRARGETTKTLAEHFSVSEGTIRRVLGGQTWAS
ncbi:MAG TPA: HNH endonuclease [Gaiellaceae bacterium]|nr:HNH endonuclease [Gaiellaceae bacterium]